jgi:hypothetical protein
MSSSAVERQACIVVSVKRTREQNIRGCALPCNRRQVCSLWCQQTNKYILKIQQASSVLLVSIPDLSEVLEACSFIKTIYFNKQTHKLHINIISVQKKQAKLTVASMPMEAGLSTNWYAVRHKVQMAPSFPL